MYFSAAYSHLAQCDPLISSLTSSTSFKMEMWAPLIYKSILDITSGISGSAFCYTILQAMNRGYYEHVHQIHKMPKCIMERAIDSTDNL